MEEILLPSSNTITFLLFCGENIRYFQNIKDSVAVFIGQESEEFTLLESFNRYRE